MNSNAIVKKEQRDEHEQFYTSRELGRLLLSHLPDKTWLKNELSVLDLCMGQGALLECVSEIAPQALLSGIDIDQLNVDAVNVNSQLDINTLCIDATTPELSKLYAKKSFDIIVGNPPFKLIRNDDHIKAELGSIGYYSSSKYIEAEIYFLLYGLKLLRDGGYLAYILPDGIFTKLSLKSLRKFLVSKFCIHSIMEIEPKSFEGTEARTHLLVIKKSNPDKSLVSLFKANRSTQVISKSEFENRGDYSYYRKAYPLKMKTLESLGAKIFRGRNTKKMLLNMEVNNYIHTSNISHLGSTLRTTLCANDKLVAIKGDIIIARVGTRCLGKFGMVESGEFFVSDCVFIVRCENIYYQKLILNTLSSPFGKSWIDSVSKGVGARHITTKDLYQLPIIVEKNENT
ncbi:N-6 DNA methylase [Vibrio nitrifigilis]|uniref:N-6 DNA methylase n=1 Tax=Vibrio nitrifigilis TaxID=2789781 RepID=A0ABS0GAZ9_9VIBR|nr:N-6 DNA methylase [Vibrio nitrifigilis]MBF8999579.1 N-6 DNA methylase [Vibrio nitrifigilis]